MSCIHQRQTDGLRTLHEIVAAVADDERLCAACDCIVHQLAAGTAADRYARDRLAAVTEAHTARPQALLNIECKFARLHFTRQIAHTTEHAVLAGLHAHHVGEEQRGRECVIDTALRTVCVGMHADNRNIVLDRVTQHSTGRIVRCHAAD